MYKSPVELITSQMNAQIEDHVFNVIQEVAVNIDKEELIKALEYDREQYKQGYADGLNANKWISVDDRLPEINKEVLIYRGSYIGIPMSIYTYLGHDEWEDEYGYWTRADDEGITHQMPLPTPPTEKEN